MGNRSNSKLMFKIFRRAVHGRSYPAHVYYETLQRVDGTDVDGRDRSARTWTDGTDRIGRMWADGMDRLDAWDGHGRGKRHLI